MAIPAVVVPGNGVNGNIGSCQVTTAKLYPDPFHVKVYATNSCTGQIVYENTYFNVVEVVGFSLFGIFLLGICALFVAMGVGMWRGY